ncbi:MAG: branched-chain amino acid ABC transporter permease [Ilumatobacteraceae bacterium]|nr:branched-chain amino acid ABC transporter permease [Ilumatobacteraceae bacterium]
MSGQSWRRMLPHPSQRSRALHMSTRASAMLILVLGAVFGVLMGAGSAGAQTDDSGPQAIFGQLDYEDVEVQEDIVVPGVIIEVDGVGTSETDDNGEFRIEVPGPGPYVVTLDVDTLPTSINLRNPENNPLNIQVREGSDQRVLFPLIEGEAGSGDDSGGVSFRRVAQLTAEGLKQGLYLAMAAIGLSLIFGTTGLVNFAHSELVTWGMLSSFFFNFYGLAGVIGFLAPLPPPFGGGVNLILAAVFGMLCGAALGYVLNRFIFRSARQAGVSLIAQMVMTIGLSILLRYFFLYLFGGSPRTFGDYAAQRAVSIGPIELTPKDIVAMSLSVVVLVAVASYLEMTKMGKAMRAVADNRDLAESTGINVERVITWVWVSGAALAAISGVFFGLDQVKWDFGFRILLLIFAAVTLGGLGKAYGALVGALIVGLAINLSTLVIDAEVKNMVALLILAVILLFRPQGILGQRERIG